MPKRTRIVVLGPTRGLPTGQAAITSIAVATLREHYRVVEINTNADGERMPARVLWNIWCMARVVCARLRGGLLYLTPHRTLLGCAKDLLALALWRLPIGARGVVCHLHGADFRGFLQDLPTPLAALVSALYGHVDLWILLSERMRDQIDMLPARHIRVIANCVAADSSALSARPPHQGALRILFLSNLIRSKGVLELCEAVRLVGQSMDSPAVELKIAGAPIEHEVATAVSAAAANRGNISYVGPAYGSAKRELLQWADIVALPSSYKSEAQPLCLLEGAIAGCYLIASRAGYIADLASHLRMHLLDDTSAITIARALSALDAEEVRALGAINRDAAQEIYSVAAFATAFATTIADFLGRRTKS